LQLDSLSTHYPHLLALSNPTKTLGPCAAARRGQNECAHRRTASKNEARAAISWESHALASPKGLFCQFECTWLGRSVSFAWLDLLCMESSGSEARRGAGAWMWPKEGWPAQHGARERWEVSLVEITTGVHRGAGGTWGAKKHTPNLPQIHFGRGAPQRASPGPLVEF
jgi:hypothetical protein